MILLESAKDSVIQLAISFTLYIFNIVHSWIYFLMSFLLSDQIKYIYGNLSDTQKAILWINCSICCLNGHVGDKNNISFLKSNPFFTSNPLSSCSRCYNFTQKPTTSLSNKYNTLNSFNQIGSSIVTTGKAPFISCSSLLIERALATFSLPFLYYIVKSYPKSLLIQYYLECVPIFCSNKNLRFYWSVIITKINLNK